MRDEARATERRAPLTPADAGRLIAAGARITVERSEKRVFADAEYAAAGCDLAEAGSWTGTPAEAVILGLKELPVAPTALPWAMIHFAHIYKDQAGWRDELARFTEGDGRLYDLEYLADETGRRVAAFGYWAGWMGAALALWRLLARRLGEPGPKTGVSSFEGRAEVEAILADLAGRSKDLPRAIVIGAKGRTGGGAAEALQSVGISVTQWDIEETRNLDRDALLAHDLLVNCVLMTGPGLLLLSRGHLGAPQNRLEMIADVSCDPFSDFNPLPVYDAPTSWDAPCLDLGQNGAGQPLELTAIDNLPSLLPREASEDFSSQLLPALLVYPDGIAWQNALAAFNDTLARAS